MKKILMMALKFVGAVLPLQFIVRVYHLICKVPPLQKMVGLLMGMVIPEAIAVEGGGTLALNKADPVVSGSLALGLYEKDELNFFRSKLKEGMVVFDVGANIGLYSVVAAHAVGSTGRVFSFEPDATNFSFLEKNANLNGRGIISAQKKAVSNTTGTVHFFLSEENKGDHALYTTETPRSSVEVQATTLDDFIREQHIPRVDVIKFDIQGAEGAALQGMNTLLLQNPDVMLFVEFYPYGLRKMGTDPAQFLQTLTEHGFTLSSIDATVTPLADIKTLVAETDGKKYVNLFAERLR